jgi:hypothetical protein
MADSHESKLDAVLRVIEALTAKTGTLENFVTRVGTSSGAGPTQHVAVESSTLLSSHIIDCSNQVLNRGAANLKEPRVNLSEKFDGTRSKFQGFVNQVRFITILQPECYPTDQSRVELVGTLLIGQALSWFAPLFEKRVPVLNKFEAFLAAFAEAFEDHNKARSTTTKILVLRQGSHPISAYALDFRLLACDINWDEEALMS